MSNSSQTNNEILDGRIIAHLGKALIVEDSAGNTARCYKRSQLEKPAVGDKVHWIQIDDDAGRVESILPRQSLLSRPAKNGKIRPVAANLDQVVVIIAVKPRIDALLLDQYLVVCEHQDLTPLIVLNKCDLLDEKSNQKTQLLIDDYTKLGYTVIKTSALQNDGLTPLIEKLQHKVSILVGQSGVGKSSIINALLPDLSIQTKTLSTASGLGKHTTTSTSLYKLPGGGDIMDSPGVNIFGLVNISEHGLADGYREIKQYANQCKYANCLHIKEPHCEVKAQLEKGNISDGRYQRYLKLREKLSY
ncbi:MAG: ribosome small subunit-dependent GTPase A [Piscirickettsiaceae bacterium]|nr:MAG: ribosome small subunit-dependent GTPase A [Piscirickettsiaceae bacterium]